MVKNFPYFLDIDPDDNNLIPYGKKIFDYFQLRDDHFRVKIDDLKRCQGSVILSRRRNLLKWLISVGHHFKCSQETFYHTVDILDRSLSRKNFRPDSLQLLGITSYWIASKVYIYSYNTPPLFIQGNMLLRHAEANPDWPKNMLLSKNPQLRSLFKMSN